MSDDDRRQMIENGDLMPDTNGDDRFAGLTAEESDEFWPLRALAIAGQWMGDPSRARYLALIEKRDRVREGLFNEEFKAKRTGRLT
ncbi:hypothetical protein [Mesorhizobium sp. M0195]|uniref:hypothetical protein n=1 Tax=Mesorhizobium sp. M0195 TaxID=2956910 RepID=UPI003338060F